jgi:hypothetical protein
VELVRELSRRNPEVELEWAFHALQHACDRLEPVLPENVGR